MSTKNLIVGIGASAGGLEALETFLNQCPQIPA
jgi:chemotaxis response regulator CheB